MNPHLPVLEEEGAPPEAAALFARAHEKLGPAPLPAALRRLGSSPVLFRDAMLNLERTLGEQPPLSRHDRLLVALGVTSVAGTADLARWLDTLAEQHDVSVEDRRAAIDVAVACCTLNAYYRVLSLAEGVYQADPQARVRASPLVQTRLPRATAEIISTAVSVAMSCKSCVGAHGKSALAAGATSAHLDEAVRIQAVLVGLAAGGDPRAPNRA